MPHPRFNKLQALLQVILICILCFFTIEFIAWQIYLNSFPQREEWFTEDFESGIDIWTVIEGTYLPYEHDEIGVLKLSSDQSYASFTIQKLQLEEIDQYSFIFHIKVYSLCFSGKEIPLGTAIFDNGRIAIVTNTEGNLGLQTDSSENIVYSTHKNAKLMNNQWENIYLYYDNIRKFAQLYHGKSLILTIIDVDAEMPLTEVCLGPNNYEKNDYNAIPSDVYYSSIRIGNKGILPKQSFLEFIKNQFWV